MIVLFIFICVVSLIGGMATEYHRQKRMTPTQQRERHRQHAQAAAGLFTGVITGTVTAAQTIVKKSGD